MSSPGVPGLQGFPQNNSPVVESRGGSGLYWTQPWLQFVIALWRRTGAAQGGVTPTGQITAFGGAVAPDGWLLCNGAAVDRTVYAALFSIIGTSFGVGDGSTTFNIPNLIDRFPIGSGAVPIGVSAGNTNVTLNTGNLPAHTHTITDPGHDHTTWDADSNVTTGTDPGGITTGGVTGTNTTGITATNSTGSGTPFSILPPYQAVNYMIKT